MPQRSNSEIAIQTGGDLPPQPAEASVVAATALASALILLAAEALRARAATRLVADAATVATTRTRRAPSRLPPIISEDEFGAWSRTLIERRLDGRTKGGR